MAKVEGQTEVKLGKQAESYLDVWIIRPISA